MAIIVHVILVFNGVTFIFDLLIVFGVVGSFVFFSPIVLSSSNFVGLSLLLVSFW